MARLAFKPDSSFFRKIAAGAVGTRAVQLDLDSRGHQIAELERGSTDTKLWKDVKRKRVRIPDLVCTHCGVRVECRAKTKAELSMSHSWSDEARAWDFGMVDTDYVAFPICIADAEAYWSAGKLGTEVSYWHERNWVRWKNVGRINYFPVRSFRAAPYTKSSTKGVTEGSETTITWPAVFAKRPAIVEAVASQRISTRAPGGGHQYPRRIPMGLRILVAPDQTIETHEVIAATVEPVTATALVCPGALPENHITHLLSSRERSLRFTGVKLARLRNELVFCDPVADLANDTEEDVYIRLEGLSYLTAVCGVSARDLFTPYLASTDPQTQLEAVIALGEAGTSTSVELLSDLLDDISQPYFLRSAAAWCLSRIADAHACTRLITAFADIDPTIREEALDGIVMIGGPALPYSWLGCARPTTQWQQAVPRRFADEADYPKKLLLNWAMRSEANIRHAGRFGCWANCHAITWRRRSPRSKTRLRSFTTRSPFSGCSWKAGLPGAGSSGLT
ncbi:MAG TPA: HEAT repeat domain-containing protein [Thermoanaerobaculia bacterium]